MAQCMPQCAANVQAHLIVTVHDKYHDLQQALLEARASLDRCARRDDEVRLLARCTHSMTAGCDRPSASQQEDPLLPWLQTRPHEEDASTFFDALPSYLTDVAKFGVKTGSGWA